MATTTVLRNSPRTPVTINLMRALDVIRKHLPDDLDYSARQELEEAYTETQQEVELLNDKLDNIMNQLEVAATGGGIVTRTDITNIIAAGVTSLKVTTAITGDIILRGDVTQLGQILSWPVFEGNETPSGTISGTNGTDGNATFTLLFAPISTGHLLLFKNNVLQIYGLDYTLSANTITFLSGSIPIASRVADVMRAYYWRIPS